jgi:hypothetical protein
LLYYSIMECNKNATFQTNNNVTTRAPKLTRSPPFGGCTPSETSGCVTTRAPKLTRSPQVTFDLCYFNQTPVTTQTIFTKEQNPIFDIKKWRELPTTNGVFAKTIAK